VSNVRVNGLSSFQPLPLCLDHGFDFVAVNDFTVWECSINIFTHVAQVNYHLLGHDVDRLEQNGCLRYLL